MTWSKERREEQRLLRQRQKESGLTNLRKAWTEMRQRCSNPKSRSYPRYGGRGIRVCERWDKFETFLLDMGMKPSPQHSIERIDNDGNYEPGNCRWATWKEQGSNSTRCSFHVVDGVRFTLTQLWEKRPNQALKFDTFRERVNRLGWPIDRALNAPVPAWANQLTALERT